MARSQSVAERVKTLRTEKGWSQRQLDQRAELAHGYTSKLEAGQIPNFSMSQLQKIADALGVELEVLLFGEERAREMQRSRELEDLEVNLLALHELDPGAINSLRQIVLAMKEKAERDFLEVRRAKEHNAGEADPHRGDDHQGV